jgi:pyruvate dehydrogenase E2 component (dihydrolipoamide acetyltransferase)
MPFTVTMPKLSPTMEAGVIAKWHKAPGDKVESGDLLLEVSTDKATVEHNALDEGYLRKILVQEGSDAVVNQPIAIFTETADESLEGYAAEGVQTVQPKAAVAEAPKAAPVAVDASAGDRIIASPLAKKLAKMRNIDLRGVRGTGPRGRIVSKDLEVAPSAPASVHEVPLTPIRKVISQRLQEAKSTIPHFYVSMDIDAENLVDFREHLSKLEVKVSINDCIVKASALALRDHPQVNTGFNPAKQTIINYPSIDISVAVSLDSGLITPIVSKADLKSISEISTDIRGLVKKAKEGKLAPAEFQGGSFTVSNLGMYGVSTFTAILNPPQSAILAVGGILDQPVVKNGIVRPGKVMHLTLSADHRVIDGVLAAQFLGTLKKYLEQPISLLI